MSEKKRFAVLKTGNPKYESNDFKDACNHCEEGEHDGVWDRKEDDWAMYFTIEFVTPTNT